MTAPTPKPSGSRRGVVQRFTGKVGPLPAWAWALLILVAGYLVYRMTGAGKVAPGTADTSSSDTTGSASDNTGSPGAGAPADNADVLAELSGLPGAVDALTALVQSSPAFYGGGGDSGSGSAVPNDGSGTGDPTEKDGTAERPSPTTTRPLVPTPGRLTPRPAASAKHRFYTYRPGTQGHPKDTAPAKGPAGTKLHFKRGKGYYYA